MYLSMLTTSRCEDTIKPIKTVSRFDYQLNLIQHFSFILYSLLDKNKKIGVNNLKTLYINEARGNTLRANTYVYYDKQSLEGVVIDPGVEAETVIKTIDSREIQIKSILLTHGHFDHTAVVPYIKRKYDVDVYALQQEHVVLSNPKFNASSLIGNPTVTKVDKYLHDGDLIQIGRGSLKVIHTPGHSIGSTCYYDEEN